MVLVSLLLAAVIFWLWLVIVPARVAILCPKECLCEAGGYTVYCSGPSLTSVALIRLTGVRIIVLRNNNITLLEKDSFVSLTELEVLFVFRCGLNTIELGAFNGLTKLTDLGIRNNKISAIIPGTFKNMCNLERLQLRYNRLDHLDIDVFSGLYNLKIIDLTGNKLQYLHPDTFLGLPKLQHASLVRNSGLHIPTDRNFIKSHSLSRLYVSRCNINSLSVETFAKVSALELLDLKHNNLKTLDINILRALPKLSELYLESNPLQCDCQLQEVWRWCEDRNIQTALWRYVPECDTPTEVKGMWWGVLKKGQCLQGKIQYYGDYNSTIYSPITDTDTDPNTGTKEYGFVSRFLKEYQVPVYAVPFIFGTISNVIILIIIICNKDMRTVPNMYILNLAISDIIYLTVLFSEACANRISDTWLSGNFMCRFLPFFRRISVSLSAYSVAVLSIQRYRVTVNPFHIHISSPPTWRVTVATICGVWIVAALFAVPSVLSKYLCEGFEVLIHITYLQLVVIFEILVSCVLPLCVIAFTYIITALHLVKSSRSISEGTQNPQLETRRNTAKIVLGLTVAFVISYVPYHALWSYIICTSEDRFFSDSLTDILIYSNNELRHTYQISTCFLLINSCLNPVALFCTSSPFRQHLKRYLTFFCKTNSSSTALELRRRN